jgi:HD-GYP domain-containing protein (c-di-GMP phosphodiesterase class II)
MTDPITAQQVRSVFDELSRRAAQLGATLWHCDAAGTILASPAVPVAVDPQLLSRKFFAMAQAPALTAVALSDGQWLVPLEQKLGSRRIALNIALVPADTEAQLRRSRQVLEWSSEGLLRSKLDERTVEQFSESLAQAYEETNLLYRMAGMLNCATDPLQSITTICQQIQEVLPFQWLAIRFGRAAYGVPELAGEVVSAGELPFALEELLELSRPLLSHTNESRWEKLLDPAKHPLAALTGAELLVEPITHDGKIVGMLLAGNKRGSDPAVNSFEMQFLDATADFLGVFHENLARFAEQQGMFIGTIRAMTASIDAKDRYTRGHSERVGLMASKMAQAMGLDKKIVEQYRIAGLVHDVGKIGVPEAVLTKPGRLTEEEFFQIQLHPGIGHNILKDIPALQSVLPGVLSHHERWDGRGYPNKLAGEEIPMIARVLALADTFDAMSSNRSYRPALPRQKVLEEISRCAGTQFDAALVPLFVSLDFSEFDLALEQHKDRERQVAA